MRTNVFVSASYISTLLAVFVLLVFTLAKAQQNILDVLSRDNNLSEFVTMVKNDEFVVMLLKFRQVTVFAPTNEAVRRYRGPNKNHRSLIFYHMANVPVPLERLPSFLSSEVQGNLPVWIKREQNYGGGRAEVVFVNNARILRSDIRGQTKDGEEQLAHIIDEMLEPAVAVGQDSSYSNPDVAKFISNPSAFGIQEQLSDYYDRIQLHNKQQTLSSGPGHTFFLPINKNTQLDMWKMVDDKVIDGHIIADRVLFTRTMGAETYESIAFTEFIKVTLSAINETNQDSPDDYEMYVQSNTIVGDSRHPRGVVVAKIVRPNIPVKNGVVHLIDRPLMVIDTNVAQLLQKEKEGRLREFYNLVSNHAPDIFDYLTGDDKTLTVFAPSNEAFRLIDPARLQLIMNDRGKIERLVRLHIAPMHLSSELILRDHITVVQSGDYSRKLYFATGLRSIIPDVTVEGGGVNATIITPDIGATNGIVHIINKVLGVPYSTLFDKLQSDGSLSQSYRLGQQDSAVNARLNDLTRKFTYFVPSDEAWNKIRRHHSSEYKQLFSGQNPYHAKMILERHQIVNKAYTIDELVDMSSVQMLSGIFKVTKYNERYFVEWEGERAEVIRPDIETMNGIMHVVDSVLMKRRDMTVAGAPLSHASFTLVLLSSLLAPLLMARFILV